MVAQGDIQVRQITDAKGRRDFIHAARPAYAGDPNYVPPLEYELGPRLDPAKNLVLQGADHALWVAEKDGVPLGRISAIINPLHLDRYKDATGQFGFLDAIDDGDVFKALFQTAEDWLRARGMKRVNGPFSFSINEECGLLIDGFDTPPYFMMPHGRDWYQRHVEALGYSKSIDMYALEWIPKRDFIPEKRLRFVERALNKPHITVRPFDFSNFKQEIQTLVDIYNDAWSDNMGFIPFTKDQAAHMADELRPIISPYNTVMCEIDGEPAAFGLVLPNLNYAIKDFDGKLLPFNWAKFLYRLKVKGIPQARMPLMGVRKKLQGKPVGAAFAYKIIECVNTANIDRGLEASELSWILENNPAMLNMLTEMGSRIYKTYRIYEKQL
ncbi:MAG: N-acetyltransferase [Pseudomonadota bacterium]